MKVESAKDGKFVYYGSDDLGTLERRDGWLINEGIVHKDRPLSILKALPNGDLIVNDYSEGWDLVLLDPQFQEKERLEGLNDPVPGYFKYIKTRTAEDDSYMIWNRGVSEISIVNTMDFSARHINNFWNYRGEQARGIATALDRGATRLVGLGYIPGRTELQTVHVFDGGDGVSIFEAADLIPDGNIPFLIRSCCLAMLGDLKGGRRVLYGRSAG